MALSVEQINDLHEAVSEQIGEKLLQALISANRTGELETLLRLLGMSDLLGKDGDPDLSPKRIAVIGDSRVKEGKLRSIIRNHGLDPSNFDFCLEYEELKHYDFNKFRYSQIYKAVLFGPAPHKTSGNRGESSVIAKMQENQAVYPLTIKICESTGELKITNNSFANALEEMKSYFGGNYQTYTERAQYAS